MKHHWTKAKSKYSAKATVVDGMRFDSKKEAKRYGDLKLLRRSGEVDFFLRQVPFHLPGPTKYLLDFLVFWSSGLVTFEDVKGHRTETYIMKKKQVEDLYGVEIKEV